MLKIIGLAVGALVCVLLVAAWLRPAHFRVTRTQTVQAPAEKLHPLIADLRQFNTWNPFASDPAMKGQYHGPSQGPGAAFHFEGGSSGAGSLHLVDAAPQKIRMELRMRKPMEGRNDIEFTLQPRGAATDVTWSMEGPMPFVGRLFSIFINLDRDIGTQFANGLAALKQRAETR